MNNPTISQSSSIKIDTILSVHCFNYTSDLTFPSRRYDYLELVYVEKGGVIIDSGSGTFHLKRGDVLFHNANVIRSITQTSTTVPVLTTAAFIASSYTKRFFENQIFSIDKTEEAIINELVMEAYNSYSSDVEKYNISYMTPAAAAPFGSEQMLLLHLQRLLIQIIRKNVTEKLPENYVSDERHPLPRRLNDNEIFDRIVSYMEDHIQEQLSIERICKDNLIGRTKLQKLFKEQTGQSVIDYFLEKKIDVAKLLISENVLNFTQISEYLGYSSIHYFSRQFKKIAGINPSEYVSLK